MRDGQRGKFNGCGGNNTAAKRRLKLSSLINARWNYFQHCTSQVDSSPVFHAAERPQKKMPVMLAMSSMGAG
jgi:hypothetical protein